MLQVNINRSRAAQGLLGQVVREKDIDVVMLSEPNKAMVTKGEWLVDIRGDPAGKFASNKIKVAKKKGEEEGYT